MLVNQVAVFVGKKLAGIVEKPEEEEVLAYGAEVVLGSLIKFTALLFFGTLLGKLIEIFVVAFTFGALRLFSGGVHFRTYYRCLVFTLATFIGLGVFADKLAQMNNSPYIFGGITFLFLVFVILQWVPGANENRVIECQERRFKFKLYSIIFVISAYGVMFFLWALLDEKTALPFVWAILQGIFWQALTVTPLGYKLFQGVEYLLDNFNLKGGLINAKKNC